MTLRSAPSSDSDRSLASETSHQFAQLYREEHDGLVRLAALMLGSAGAAEDIVQETFARLYRRFAKVENPKGWLRGAVINACRNEYRRLGVVRRYLASRPSRPVTEPEPPELLASLRRLPPRQRAVVVLRFYEDRSEADIAKLMHVRLGTVKATLSRALVQLRKEVER